MKAKKHVGARFAEKGSWLVTRYIGYGHPRLVQAIKNQPDDLPYALRCFTNDPAVELAENLVTITPDELSKVLFTTGGSDADEVALKIARAATGRFSLTSAPIRAPHLRSGQPNWLISTTTTIVVSILNAVRERFRS